MGAASSFLTEDLPAEMKELMEKCEKQKYTISEYDSALMNREMAKVFKKHNKIITCLTSRTKTQLRKMNTIRNSTPDDISKSIGSGNNYGKFMKCLFMSKQEIEMETIKASNKDYDEELLISIIGTSSNKEMKLLDEAFKKEYGKSIMDLIEEKIKRDTPLERFLKLVMKFDRDESKDVNLDLAREQAADLHKAGAARLIGLDEDVIFTILTGASRAQCAAIAESYLQQFRMKLERAINMKFKGNCSKLLNLWTHPLPHAVASWLRTLTERLLIDKLTIVSFLAKYDKDFIGQVDVASEKMFEKNLIGLVQRGVSGNLLKAIIGWIENPTPDKGYERVMDLYLESKIDQGHELKVLSTDPEFQKRITFLLSHQTEEIEKYMKENRIKFNPEDKLDLSILKTAIEHSDTPKAAELSPNMLRKYSVKSPDASSKAYEPKLLTVRDYLKKYLGQSDPNQTGYFDAEDFWKMLKAMPLSDFGLTEKEIDEMKHWAEWDIDGTIFYHEILPELTDTIINSIENKTDGDKDVLAVMNGISQPRSIKYSKSERRLSRHNSVSIFGEVPEYFQQFLYDTFSAFDFDENSYLCSNELTSLLEVMNIPQLSVGDFLKEGMEYIDHKAAVEIVSKTVAPWFANRAEDHYICLVDKDSGLYFWYNTKDESSQWADTDESYVENNPDGSRRATVKLPAENSPFADHLVEQALGFDEFSRKYNAPSSPRAPEKSDEDAMEKINSDSAAQPVGDSKADDKAEAKDLEETKEASSTDYAAEDKAASGSEIPGESLISGEESKQDSKEEQLNENPSSNNESSASEEKASMDADSAPSNKDENLDDQAKNASDASDEPPNETPAE